MAEFVLIAAVAILLLAAFDVAALRWGADSRIDTADAASGRVGIS